MNLKQTRLHILRRERDLSGEFKTGVSLHCHTGHSRELLDFIPRQAEKLPVVKHFWKRERRKYYEREGKYPDFSTAFWSPPLGEQAVFDDERAHINRSGLQAIVSVTDHDTIAGNLKISETIGAEKAPISMEWTVPYAGGFFHLGVHNLPERRAVEISEQLLDYTFADNRKDRAELIEILELLNSQPGVLIVFNHPLWDAAGIGGERHGALLKKFIREYAAYIHALEINGFRPWSENKAVIEWAEALNIPLVSGGDRHGCRPNTVVNLTDSRSFAEFAGEIRVDKRSEVALLPEYLEPLVSRQLQSFSDILKLYPEFPEHRRKWFDRVYVDIGDGFGVRQLSAHWRRGGPVWLRWAIRVLAVLGHENMRPAFRFAGNARDVVPHDASKVKFEIPNLDEFTVEPDAELHHNAAY